VQVKSFADAPGHLWLARIFRSKVDVGLNILVVAAIGGRGPPGMEIHAGGVSILAPRERIRQSLDSFGLLQFISKKVFRHLSRTGEVSCASMWEIQAKLNLRASVVVGSP
jgi:hypothetical protein